MTAIYIIIAILIPLAILLCSPFKIYVSCINNKFSIKIRYLFLKKLLLPNKKNNLSENKNVKEKNKRKRARPPIDTGFIEAPFREVMDKWLEYKRARGQTYKSETSIKTCYKKLLEMSGGDPVKAEAIVENSIANNYAGIFPLKNTSLYVTDKPTASTSLTEEERERSFLEHINRKLGNIP